VSVRAHRSCCASSQWGRLAQFSLCYVSVTESRGPVSPSADVIAFEASVPTILEAKVNIAVDLCCLIAIAPVPLEHLASRGFALSRGEVMYHNIHIIESIRPVLRLVYSEIHET